METANKWNSEFEMKMDDDSKRFLWGVINENSNLQQENHMLKNKLEQINRLLRE